MITLGILISFAALLVIFVYTTSYGIWTWKSKNKLGAAVIFLLAIATIILPVYKLFFKE